MPTHALRIVSLALAGAALAACAPANTPKRVAEAPQPVTAIVGATLINPDRDGASAVVPESTIVFEGDRITAVGKRASTFVPAGATVVDGKGKWVIPALVDSHVHFFQSANLYTRPDAADFNAVVSYEKETARNKARLPETFKVWLRSGVTSVVDIGGGYWNFEVRDLARKSAAAPRVATAGPLISLVDRVKLDIGDPPIIKVTTPDEARALVAKQLPYKPDFIKVWFIHLADGDLAKEEAIVRAAGDAAHAAGVRLAVHGTELAVAKAALRAGADVLVHSVTDLPVDGEFIELAKKSRAIYVPTMFVFTSYQLALSNQWRPTEAEQRLGDPEILGAMRDLDRIPKDQVPPRVAQMVSAAQPVALRPVILENLKKVWDAGIPVAMGTDAGNIGTIHGPSVFREMDLMVKAGLTPLQVLRASTVNGARVMGLEKSLGSIHPRMLADLVVLDADPLADINNASRIHAVFKAGREVALSEPASARR